MAIFQTTIWQSVIVDAIYRYDIEASDAEEAKQKAREIVNKDITCEEEDGFLHFQYGDVDSLNPNGDTEISIEGEVENITIPNNELYKTKDK